ncbi:MAG: hypothetical protein ACFFHD_03845 [Promethearchaeota archaeon]
MAIKQFTQQAQFMVRSHRKVKIVNRNTFYNFSIQKNDITNIFNPYLKEEIRLFLKPEVVEITLTEY